MTIHTIQSGETLTSIAKKYNTTVDKLAQQNNIKDKNVIVTGNTLNVGDGFQREEVPPMLKRPEEQPAPAAPKKKQAPAAPQGPSVTEQVIKAAIVPGYPQLKIGEAAADFVTEHREEITAGAQEAVKRVFIPGYNTYKIVTSEPVQNAARAASEFVQEHKEEITTGAQEAAKHAFLPGYNTYKVVTSEPVQNAARAAADFAKKAGSAALGFIKWMYE